MLFQEFPHRFGFHNHHAASGPGDGGTLVRLAADYGGQPEQMAGKGASEGHLLFSGGEDKFSLALFDQNCACRRAFAKEIVLRCQGDGASHAAAELEQRSCAFDRVIGR
jgi:hypothetical protein